MKQKTKFDTSRIITGAEPKYGLKWARKYTEIKGNIFEITRYLYSTGTQYISITKKTNNPFGGIIGRDFPNWEEAAKSYKSPEMKTALLMAEIEFKANGIS